MRTAGVVVFVVVVDDAKIFKYIILVKNKLHSYHMISLHYYFTIYHYIITSLYHNIPLHHYIIGRGVTGE